MSSYQFLPGMKFRWNKTNYQVKDVVSQGKLVLIEDLFTGGRRNVEIAELIEAFFRNGLQFEINGKHAKIAKEGELNTEVQFVSLEDCPDHLAKTARWRLSVIEPFVNMRLPKRTTEMVEKRVDQVKSQRLEGEEWYKLSVRSVYRWLQDYERSNGDIRALIPAVKGRCGGAGKSRLDERVDYIIDEKIEEIYLKKWVRSTITDVYEAVALQITEENKSLPSDMALIRPSYSTIARRIAQLDPKEVFKVKHGSDATRKKFKQYGSMDYPELPLERVEIDHTLLDLIVLDDMVPLGRLTFTFCVDTATRYPLGYYLG